MEYGGFGGVGRAAGGEGFEEFGAFVAVEEVVCREGTFGFVEAGAGGGFALVGDGVERR